MQKGGRVLRAFPRNKTSLYQADPSSAFFPAASACTSHGVTTEVFTRRGYSHYPQWRGSEGRGFACRFLFLRVLIRRFPLLLVSCSRFQNAHATGRQQRSEKHFARLRSHSLR